MADGAVTYSVTVDAATAERLDAVAREAGVAPEALVVEILEDAAAWPAVSETACRFQHDAATRALDEYDRTGESVDAGPALDDFVAKVEAQAASRA